MSHWKIPGKNDPALAVESLRTGIFEGEVRVETIQSVRVDVDRASGKTATLSDLAADEVLEIELEGGIKLWARLDQFKQDFREQLQPDRDSGDLFIPTYISFGPRARGGGWAIKAIQRLAVILGEKMFGKVDVAGITASALSGVLEKKFMEAPGFYQCITPKTLKPVNSDSIPTDNPILVFLHGTFSNTMGSFGDLASDNNRNLWRELQKTYNQHIYTLDHHTLSQSPIENAVNLMNCLPKGATLHLVSHSRGGMIGELLCRSQRQKGDPFDEHDLRAIQGDFDGEDDLDNREAQYQALKDLNRLLRDKQPKVERFIRVACPASGTTLASGRLDRWLSMIVNAMKLIPALSASTVFDLASSFMLAVIKQRMNPRVFPGLEAMVPDSPLIKVLNRPDIETSAGLTVISGNLEGAGIWGTLKTWITDLFYKEDNDIIVNTNSMYGGARRLVPGGFYFLDQGDKVDHFHYFENQKTARKLRDGLQRKNDEPPGFALLAQKRRQLKEKRKKLDNALTRQRDDGTRPVVFLLPGIMGSQLSLNGNVIWADCKDLAMGKLAHLKIDTDGVTPDGLLASPYADIVEYLSSTHKVIPFSYDWRRSLLEEADRLADAVSSELKAQSKYPVRILAHSMGGLLARSMIARRPKVWKQMIERDGSRLVMLGTPNNGSFSILHVLLGRDKILRMLAALDFRHSKREILEIISRYIGVLNLLPYGKEQNFFDAKIWDDLVKASDGDWVCPRKQDLKEAGKMWDSLHSGLIDPKHMIYVAGLAPATPIDIEIDEEKKGRQRIRFLATSQGDGRVPWSTGIPVRTKTWYMEAEHGKLADHRPAFPAIEELLIDGTTTMLSQSPLPTERGADERFELPADEFDAYPDELDIEAAALGFTATVSEERTTERVRVSLLHDNLAYASYPVAVGHHEGDAIMAAEAKLDFHLDGKLSVRHDLRLYPGPVGTSEVVLQVGEGKALRPKSGAIVIGLGRIGELLPNELEDGFAQGALQYALVLAEEAKAQSKDPPAEPISAPISSLLIGSGFGGLSNGDSIRAILLGTLRANQALEKAKLDAWVKIDELQFVELYRERAIEAALFLQDLSREKRYLRQFEMKPHVQPGSAGQRWIPTGETAEWWHHLRIAQRSEDDPTLSFTVLTDRARAEVNLLPDQQIHVDRFVRRAVSSTRWNNKLANTLFHLLLPNELKHFARDRRNLVLVLAREAARYPWELLHDQSAGDTAPFGTRCGLIRQLVTERFRRDVEYVVSGTALVVGDPPSDLIPLPGAEQEAREVTDRLSKNGFDVNDQIKTSAESIETALFARDYQLVHLAGHGVYDPKISDTTDSSRQPLAKSKGSLQESDKNRKDKRFTGMVIGKNLILTPAQINQMPRIPELVFINCCHLGRQDVETQPRSDYHLIAANLATQFIEMGVRAVVATGWAVDDRAALTFALEFYDQLLRGREFGYAVREARRATYENYPGVNTWGAYQCYGDPSYRLRRRSVRRPRDDMPNFVSPEHAFAFFDNIKQRALTASSENVNEQKTHLERFIKKVPKAFWQESASLYEVVGNCYAELKIFDQAIHFYEKAIDAGKGEVSLRVIEQAANLRARWAKRSASPKDAVALIKRSIQDLENLINISKSAERYSLLGSAYKSLGELERKRNKLKIRNLEKIAESYRKAYEISKDDAYPLTNWLTAALAIGKRPSTKEVGAYLDKAIGYLHENLKSKKDFWTYAMLVDCDVIRHLYRRDLKDHRGKLAKRYKEAWKLGGSPRQIDSVYNQFKFQIRILSSQPMPSGKGKKQAEKVRDELIEALQFIDDELRRYVEQS